MSFASDRQRASFDHAQRVHERILRAGPPEPELFTVSYRTEVFAEGPYRNPEQVLAWLRQQLGEGASITFLGEDETVRFAIEDQVEDIEHEDHAREVIENLITGGPHQLVTDDLEIDDPTDDEPDWDAIAKDRRIDEDSF